MVWEMLFTVAILCVLSSSVRIAIVGLGHLPTNQLLRLFTHDAWNFSFVLLMPMLLGQFARQELSPIPWLAYSSSAARHGPIDGVTEAALVIGIELWLFWIPAHSFIRLHPELDKRTKSLARALNLTIGLLLVTPNNPVYMLIGVFH